MSVIPIISNCPNFRKEIHDIFKILIKVADKPTWVSGGEIEVGEVDDIVIALLLFVEEPELGRSANNIVSDDALWREGN